MADRHLIGGLALVFAANRGRQRIVTTLQMPLEPGQARLGIGAHVPQNLQQVDDEGIGPGATRLPRWFLEIAVHFLGGKPLALTKVLMPRFGFLALVSCRQNARGQAAQIFQQAQPQHDGHGPQLTNGERRDRLIARNEQGRRARRARSRCVR